MIILSGLEPLDEQLRFFEDVFFSRKHDVNSDEVAMH